MIQIKRAIIKPFHSISRYLKLCYLLVFFDFDFPVERNFDVPFDFRVPSTGGAGWRVVSAQQTLVYNKYWQYKCNAGSSWLLCSTIFNSIFSIFFFKLLAFAGIATFHRISQFLDSSRIFHRFLSWGTIRMKAQGYLFCRPRGRLGAGGPPGWLLSLAHLPVLTTAAGVFILVMYFKGPFLPVSKQT